MMANAVAHATESTMMTSAAAQSTICDSTVGMTIAHADATVVVVPTDAQIAGAAGTSQTTRDRSMRGHGVSSAERRTVVMASCSQPGTAIVMRAEVRAASGYTAASAQMSMAERGTIVMRGAGRSGAESAVVRPAQRAAMASGKSSIEVSAAVIAP